MASTSGVSNVTVSRKRSSSLRASSTSTAHSTMESSSDSEDDSHFESSSTGEYHSSRRTGTRKAYKQAYRSEWEDLEDLKGWLTRSRTKRGMAFCKFCNCNLEAKLCDLRRHLFTKKHIDNKRLLCQQQTLFSCTSQATALHNNVSRAEALWANFTAEHNLAFTLSDHATKLFPKMFPDSEVAKKFSSGRTKTTAIVTNVLAPFAREKLITCMRSKPFSLLFDEATDIAVVKSACMVVRIFDDEAGTVRSEFYRLVQLGERADAQTLFEAIESAFEEDHIPFTNMIGFASDGANAMMGSKNSVRTRLKAKQPNLFVIHCICHVAALCASHACKHSIPNEVEQLLRDTYNFFHQSSKRLSQLTEFQHFVNVQPHQLLHPSQTRWLSLHQCVARMVEQWPALRSYFASTEERLVVVQRTLQNLDKPTLKLYFLFLNEVLPLFNRFNQLFQSERPLLHVLHTELIILYKKFLMKFIKQEVVEAHAHNILELNIEEQCHHLSDQELYIGIATREFIESNCDIDHCQIKPFYSNCRKYFIASVQEMRKRCPLDNCLLKQLGFLDPPKCQQVQLMNIILIAQQFENVIKDDEIEVLKQEVEDFKLHAFDEEFFKQPTYHFWKSVGEIEDPVSGTLRYPMLSRLTKALLILPHGNADTERVFSKMNLIKTKLRNCIGNKSMNALLTLNCNNCIPCYEFDPPNTVIHNVKNAMHAT